jgi:ATP-binding cassette subfamily B protein
VKLIFRSMGKYGKTIFLAVALKLLGTLAELSIPYILEHIIDYVVPLGQLKPVILWGCLMFAAAIVTRMLNVTANRWAIENAHRVSYDVRQALFRKIAYLSGNQFDAFGLPSLISRMTSDSYNVQSAAQQLQALCIRAPMLLLGGVAMTLAMDASLAMILVIMLPLLILIVLAVSAKGIPMYTRVQGKLDVLVRIMRENITGIRVVKALSKAEYEKRRFADANGDMTDTDINASTVMAIPGPFLQFCLNVGLTLVVLLGARRVNNGSMEPGVILAFLTYFNMIAMGVMGLTRIFMTMSKASASANRIDEVLRASTDQRVLAPEEGLSPAGPGFIRFENVGFRYGEDSQAGDSAGFAGEGREKALENISFTLEKGESLGIIGPTGCGKSTVIQLLLRFYDAGEGGIFLDGRDVRTYDRDELRSRFGVCFQNDMVFQDTLRENVNFGRGLSDDEVRAALGDAMALEYVDALPEGLN